MARARVWLAALVLALPPIVVAVSWAALAPQLPETVATHWSGTGVADGVSATVPTAIALLATTTAILIVGLALAALRIADQTRAMLLSTLAAVSGMLAAAWVVSAVTTVEAGSAEGAVLGGWIALLLGSVVLLFVPWLIHPDDPARRGREHALPLAPSDAGSWRGEAASTPMLAIGVAVAAAGLLVAALLPIATGPWMPILLGAVLLAGALVCIALARIRVLVDDAGLRVRGALVPVPLRTVPLERIRAVEAVVVEPFDWGGWGYRAMPGRVAIVLRRGPGIVVTTREGSRFAVTVEGAQEGGSALAALVARARDAGTDA